MRAGRSHRSLFAGSPSLAPLESPTVRLGSQAKIGIEEDHADLLLGFLAEEEAEAGLAQEADDPQPPPAAEEVGGPRGQPPAELTAQEPQPEQEPRPEQEPEAEEPVPARSVPQVRALTGHHLRRRPSSNPPPLCLLSGASCSSTERHGCDERTRRRTCRRDCDVSR